MSCHVKIVVHVTVGKFCNMVVLCILNKFSFQHIYG